MSSSSNDKKIESHTNSLATTLGIKMLISPQEKNNNYYFRGGDFEHVFEWGQNFNDNWKNRTENEVLIDRVYKEQKPLASIVCINGEYQQDVEKARELDLHVYQFRNK